MITGITTSVLKGANAPGSHDQDGDTTGEQTSELHSHDGRCESDAIPYDRVVLDGQQAVTRSEPAELATNPLAAPNAAQSADRGHDNVQAAYPTPGTGRGAGRDANGTRTR